MEEEEKATQTLKTVLNFFVIKKQFEEIQIIDVQCFTNNYSPTEKLNISG